MSPQGIMSSEEASNNPGLCPVRWRCLLRELCPARRPVTTLDCVLLKDRNLALAPRQCAEINSRAYLRVLPRPEWSGLVEEQMVGLGQTVGFNSRHLAFAPQNGSHCYCILTWTAAFSSIISTAMFLSAWSLCRCWRSWRVTSVSLSVLNASDKVQNLFCNTVPQPGTIIPTYHTTLASGEKLSIIWLW